MPGARSYILDASALIALKQVAAFTNSMRPFEALLAPGRMVITSTVRAEATVEGKPGSALLESWLTQQEASGRLVVERTLSFPPGT